jgi:lipoprotein-releasing system permease protein
LNLSLFIAKRYFRSKKKRNFIQVISIISMMAVAIGTAALIIVLSVFNGLEELIRDSYNTFDPEIKVVPAQGKSFVVTDSLLNSLSAVEGIDIITEVIEDNALALYRDAQMLIKLKGVSNNFIDQHRIDKAMVYGELNLQKGNVNYAILGRGVQYALSIAPADEFYALRIYYPKKSGLSSVRSINLSGNAYNQKSILPGGVFAIEQQFDSQYVIVPLSFAQELFDYEDRRTALEIKTTPESSVREVQQKLQSLLGSAFKVLNSDEQHAGLLRAIKIEKLFVYLTFSFILAIASFNIFFSLSMLAIEKKKDVAMLFAMGATRRTVKSIFLYEGAIIALTGATIGLVIALALCWVQQEFGIVSMGMQTAIVDAYPVKMQFSDFFFTALSIIVITFFAAYRPASIASHTEIKDYL